MKVTTCQEILWFDLLAFSLNGHPGSHLTTTFFLSFFLIFNFFILHHCKGFHYISNLFLGIKYQPRLKRNLSIIIRLSKIWEFDLKNPFILKWCFQLIGFTILIFKITYCCLFFINIIRCINILCFPIFIFIS